MTGELSPVDWDALLLLEDLDKVVEQDLHETIEDPIEDPRRVSRLYVARSCAPKRSGTPTTINTYTRTRKRGFAPYRPQEKARALIAQVQEVLREYADFLPSDLLPPCRVGRLRQDREGV